MKRWFGFWILIIWLVSAVFGQTLDLQVSTTVADINTPLTATVTVAWVEWWWSVAIQGIEAFDILNQSRSQSVQVANGRQLSQVQLILSLQPKAVWTYTLWPATIETSNGTVTSRFVEVEVSGESLFGNNTQIFPPETDALQETNTPLNRILRIFIWLVLVLIGRVYRAFRFKQWKSFWSPNYQHDAIPIPKFSWKYSDNKSVNTLIIHAVQTIAVADEKTSISMLQQLARDWNLQWLLARVEKLMYGWGIDPLLDDDIREYLDERESSR